MRFWAQSWRREHSKLQTMRKEFPFEKLEVWQDARQLVRAVYPCAESFPASERYGMTSQLTRATVSVANNLAEGSGRSSLKDQAHYSSQSYSSLMETACDLILSTDLGFTSAEGTGPILNQAYDLSVRIHNLRESQLRRAAQA
jgi:four helix bundle protein